MNRILLAHDGSRATLAAIPWLARRHGAEVSTLTLDLGQPGSLADVREHALEVGAVRAHVIDAREQLAEQLVLPALRAGAVCLDEAQPLVGPLASPIVAQRVAEVAAMEQASSIAHATRTGRLPRLLAALTPTPVLPSVAAAMTPEERARLLVQLGAAAAERDDAHGVEPAGRATFWGRPAPRLPVQAAATAADAGTRNAGGSGRAAIVEIDLERGVPTRINGVSMPFLELVASLETIAAGHGVGILGIGNRESGIRKQELGWGWYAPAALILSRAFRALEPHCLSSRLLDLRRPLAGAYVELLSAGDWFLPDRAAIDAFTARAFTALDGRVRFELAEAELRLVSALPGVGTNEHDNVVVGPVRR